MILFLSPTLFIAGLLPGEGDKHTAEHPCFVSFLRPFHTCSDSTRICSAQMRRMCEHSHPSFVKLLSANSRSAACVNTAGNSPEGNTAGGHIEGLLSLLSYNQLSMSRINTKVHKDAKKQCLNCGL